MTGKAGIIILTAILLLSVGCSRSDDPNKVGIIINNISSSIGAVRENTNNHDTQSFKYTLTLTNNDAADIIIISIEPVLSEEFLKRVTAGDITIKVNSTIPQGDNLDVSGEIIFDAKGLTKEQIINMEPFVKEVRIVEERVIDKSF